MAATSRIPQLCATVRERCAAQFGTLCEVDSIVVQGESTGPSMTAPKALVVVSGYTGSGKSTIAEAIAEAIGATTISFDWVMSALRTFPEVWAVVESPVERQRSVGWTLMARIAEQQLRPGRGRVVSGGIGVESEVEQPIRPGRGRVVSGGIGVESEVEQPIRPGRGRVVSGGIGVESEVEQPIRPGRGRVVSGGIGVESEVEQPIRPGRGRVVSGGIGVESEVEQPIRHGRGVVLDLVGRHGALELWADLAERTGAKMSIVECVCSDADVHRARVVGRDRGIPGWYELTVADVERSRAAYQPLDVAKIVVDSVNPLGSNLDAVMKHLNRAV